MTTPLHLTDDELLSLTHRRRPSAQARALQAMAVPYRRRPDGTLLVGALQPSGRSPALPQRNPSARRQPMGCAGAGRREDF